VVEGFRLARWPGRLERCPGQPALWWDGAHNAAGARALAQTWREAALPPASALVLATSRDKDAGAMLDALAPRVPGRRAIVTRTHSERALPPEELARLAAAGGWRAAVSPDVASACRRALESASVESPALLTGSLFAVGEAMEAFGGAPGSGSEGSGTVARLSGRARARVRGRGAGASSGPEPGPAPLRLAPAAGDSIEPPPATTPFVTGAAPGSPPRSRRSTFRPTT